MMAVKRICPKCKRPSYSANTQTPMPCAYEDCDGIVPPPKEESVDLKPWLLKCTKCGKSTLVCDCDFGDEIELLGNESEERVMELIENAATKNTKRQMMG